MRVVGGQFRGRALATPADQSVRPTSDRVREAVFNILVHGAAAVTFTDKKVLDLFAGTGALGIEAVSRGAAQCLFVDEGAEARGVMRENIEALGLTGITKVFRRDATSLGEAGKYGAFDIVFLDPPYGKGLADRAIASALKGGWIAEGATVVIEEARGAVTALPAGLVELDRRVWGDTEVVFARASRPAGGVS
jgi:16S rRNA (guanine966-N2)-methyltransferase